MTHCVRILLFQLCLMLISISYSDVVINEINYDPIDNGDEGGGLREFVELYNPGPDRINLTGYQFTDGISYTFPTGSYIDADEYLVVVKTPTHRTWRNKRYQVLGPYDGKLSNGGERITLAAPDSSIVERFSYNDDLPWPPGADGYGPTLERISWELPADDFHSWRTSTTDEGTPGAENTVVDVIPRPVIMAIELSPEFPTSNDPVTIQIGIDSPQSVVAANLQYETEADSTIETETVFGFNEDWKYWKGTASPSDGLEWTQPDFDDSSWETETGGFGYGDLNEVETVLSDMRNLYTTFYIRKKIDLAEDEIDANYVLDIYFDDGFICYINGIEIVRSYAPSSYTYRSTSSGNHESNVLETFELGDLSSILTPGENTIALVGFNTSLSNSSDFALTPSLSYSKTIDRRENLIPMSFAAEMISSATLEAVIPAFDSQTLVRCNVVLELGNSETLVLPHLGERHPFISYFVYDGEIETKIPILWIYDDKPSNLPEIPNRYNAAIAVFPDSREPQVYDGVTYIRSENGNKLRFLKGEEFRGDRTINIIPENPPFGGTAGSTGPFREFLGLWFYEYMRILTPRGDWFRVIEDPGTRNESMTQRLIVQQINEKFLEMNDRDSDTDLYKLEWNIGFVKHTNKDEGSDSIQELLTALNTRNETVLKSQIEQYLDVEEFLTYSVANVLCSNWDGFFNNNWMYLNPEDDGGKWEVIPWDLDKIWGFTDSQFMFVEMPVDFPLDGRAQHASRDTGPITGPFHKVDDFHEEYKRRLRIELDRVFAPDAPIHSVIDEWEQILLEDLALIQNYTEQSQSRRRNQITDSMDVLREFIQLRKEFLDGVLPAPVLDWSMF
jgi:hypothetical protein